MRQEMDNLGTHIHTLLLRDSKSLAGQMPKATHDASFFFFLPVSEVTFGSQYI